MRNFKFNYLWIFLIVFLSGKMHSEIYTQTIDATHYCKKKEITAKLKKAADTGKEKYTRPRNKKPRAKESAVPQISEVTFAGYFIYKSFKFPHSESVYPSFQHCISLKRGPPVV